MVVRLHGSAAVHAHRLHFPILLRRYKVALGVYPHYLAGIGGTLRHRHLARKGVTHVRGVGLFSQQGVGLSLGVHRSHRGVQVAGACFLAQRRVHIVGVGFLCQKCYHLQLGVDVRRIGFICQRRRNHFVLHRLDAPGIQCVIHLPCLSLSKADELQSGKGCIQLALVHKTVQQVLEVLLCWFHPGLEPAPQCCFIGLHIMAL